MSNTETDPKDPEPDEQLRSISIVVADDDPRLLQLISRTLRILKHTLLGHARNGREAVEMVERLAPEMVIMDIDMPMMDGIEAAGLIREKHNMPIIMITGEAREATLRRLRNLNIGAYLVKPFSPAQLKAAIFIAMMHFQSLEKSEAA